VRPYGMTWRGQFLRASVFRACFCSLLLYVACMTESSSHVASAAARRLTRAQRIARLRDALAREISREKEERRRADTRRKIVLGAAVISLLTDETLALVSKHNLANRLLSLIAERDRGDMSAFLSSLLPPAGSFQTSAAAADLPSAQNRPS